MNGNSSPAVKRAWTFYDWANSVYPLVISTAIFPIFYNEVAVHEVRSVLDPVSGKMVEAKFVNFLGSDFVNTEIYGYIISASLLIVALISPVLSGIADYSGRKKFFLSFFCVLGSLATMALFFFDVDFLEVSMAALFLASIGYWASIVFYNSYLPDIAPKEEHDSLSAKGFSLGYIGSVILLVLNLVMLQVLHWEAKWCFITVGIWWLGFAQYTLIKLPGNPYQRKSEGKVISRGFKELRAVAYDAWNARRLWWYLLSFFVFSMSVQTIMLMAQFFGVKEVWRIGENGERIQGMETGQLIIAILLVQIIAIPGAYLFSYSAKKLGNILSLKIAMVLWIATCVFAYAVVDTPTEFWIAAGMIGFIMGGTQSLSRSTYSKFLPETQDTTSYFSFYDVLEKFGIIIGTISFGYIEGITGTMRNSVLALIGFFLIGLILLFIVPKKERFLKPREELRHRGVASE